MTPASDREQARRQVRGRHTLHLAVLLPILLLGQEGANTLEWQAGAPGSDEFLVRGVAIRALESGSVRVYASPVEDTGRSLRTLLTFENTATDARVDIRPEQFRLRLKEGELAYVDPAKVAGRAKRRARTAAAIIGGLAGFSNPRGEATDRHQVTVTDSEGRTAGTYSGTTTRRDPDATAEGRATAQARKGVRRAEALAAGIVDSALLGTTLMPGGEVTGCVHFERKKKPGTVVLIMPIGEKCFRIPLMPAKQR